MIDFKFWKQNALSLKKACFFILMVITIFPIFVLPLESAFYHDLKRLPKVIDGAIDLTPYNLENGEELPLNGKWELYWNKWIISEQIQDAQPDLMVRVPNTWTLYRINGKRLPSKGIASYRLQLENDEVGLNVICYIPYIEESYRIFLNGELISSRGEMDQRLSSSGNRAYRQIYDPVELPVGTNELVIEVLSVRTGGLNRVPVLNESERDMLRKSYRDLNAAIYIGILISSIAGIAFVLLIRDPTFHSVALLVMDILMLMRVLSKDEFFQALGTLFPILRSYSLIAIIQSITLFLPVVFLFCAHQLVELPLSKRSITHITLYELVFSPLIFWFGFNGYPFIQQIFCIFSYLPFAFVLFRMYKGICAGVPYSLIVTAILSLALGSMIVGNLNISGLLVFNFSLVGPSYFVCSAVLQNYLYILKNQETHAKLIESENLKLRLQESERSIMLSQIKPHFLYNALITIQVLCQEDAQTAAETVEHFANYLRMNMRSIDSRDPIPFSDELKHIENYVAIELLRFQERLQMEYDIQATDFKIPPLSIQPLVENAIKHGACKNIQGGTVLLKTYETEKAFIVEVRDDGPGFDPQPVLKSKEPHGLQNIIFRLREWTHADVDITSRLGSGTDVVISVPKGSSK